LFKAINEQLFERLDVSLDVGSSNLLVARAELHNRSCPVSKLVRKHVSNPGCVTFLSDCGQCVAKQLHSPSLYVRANDHIGGKIYAVTTAGLQQISLNSAVSVSPVFDDYLTGKRSESRDEETGKIITGDLTATLQAGCNVIGSRYVVVSCTSNYDNLYEFAWIYDVHLKRWGKVNQVHTGIAQLKESDSPEDMTILDIGPEIPVEMFGEATIDSFVTDPTAEITAYRQQLGLVRPDGSIYRVVLGQGELGEIAPGGFLQVSGLQLTRNRMMTLQRVEFEGTQTATMQLFPSYDGRTVEDAIGTDFWSLVATDEDLTVFGGMITAQNFAFNLQGNFDLSTIIVRATTEGQQ